MINIIRAELNASKLTHTAPVYQYNRGMILEFSGVELPPACEVDFANSLTGKSITQIATNNRVIVPEQFFTPGSTIYVWIVFTGADYTVTRYLVNIPVSLRAERTNEEPTPEEQSAIDEAIAALNEAVTDAQTAIEHYPKIEDGTWRVWDVMNGEWVDTGVEAQGEHGPGVPTGGTTGQVLKKKSNTDYDTEWADDADHADYTGLTNKPQIEGVTLEGNKTASDLGLAKASDIPSVPVQGVNGKTGDVVLNAADVGAGTYSKPSGGIPANDMAGEVQTSLGKADTAYQKPNDGIPASDLASGVIPAVPSASDATPQALGTASAGSSSNYSRADHVHAKPSAADVGAVPAGQGIPSGGTDGQMLVKKSGTDYDTEWANQPSVPVQDVQINGTSILSQGVADIPYASTNDAGVVKIDAYLGVDMDATSKKLFVDDASLANVKAGIEAYKPITPRIQESSTFYGLAKASGDTTQSASSNPVGTYTDDAKIAIQKMLGIYQAPWELIREDTVTNATEEDIEITVDGNGETFELTDARIKIASPIQETEFIKGDYGRITFKCGNENFHTYVGAYTTVPNGSARISYAALEQSNGMLVRTWVTNTGSGSDTANIRARAQLNDGPDWWYLVSPKAIDKIIITSVKGTLTYKLYGKRKWQ